MSHLSREFFCRPTLEVASELIGATLYVHHGDSLCGGRIVEVEAYLGAEDAASHAARGPTPRSRIMFGPAAVAYVYLIYGVHHCLNFVTEIAGRPGAVLIRAIEPSIGREAMIRRRGLQGRSPRDRDLAAGPGRLCVACGIDRNWNGVPLDRESTVSRRIWVEYGENSPGTVAASPRIGIRRAADLPYRFVDPASDCLSR